ncbi:stathmin domain-containing 1 isoform X1 [Paramuricea clavata]|uniref:Stathmin domain-containing 1 isoform X1 n=1 Tax=Paramuricea clavata TaxID=317549 RepID=A0A6S7GZC1_PARCT|nr:stathmin domain-containing 1 isoform X1 [Paramuricea clavata]
MGCGSSRAVIVPSDCNIKNNSKSSLDEKKRNSAKNSDVSLRNNNVSGQGGSATDLEERLIEKRREISASSTRTADSGISELPDENIITENTNPNKLLEHGISQRPETPDLVLEGVGCPRKQSGKERRLELQKKNSESSVPKLPPLTNNSLLERPKTRGGVAFDITFCPETGNMKKAQLPKLERRKKKKKLTKEELEEKMRKATERRQQHNKKIQAKSHAFVEQYENVVQRRNNAMESNNGNAGNSGNTRDDVTEIMDISGNQETDMTSQ